MADGSDESKAQEAPSDDARRWFDDAPDAIVLLDPVRETVVDANPKACELYGFAHADFLGMAFAGVVPDLGGLAGGALEIVHYRADGSEVFLEVRASTTAHQGQPATLCVLRDVTQRQSTEQRRQAAAAVRLAAHARRELLATLSHELRTPLASIVGLADLLLALRLGDPAPELAGLIRSAAERLVGALDDAADRFEAGGGAAAVDPADPPGQPGPVLAREILERWRGETSAQPTPAGDPLDARDADAESGESEARILLAEDDPVNRMVALHQLRALGYRVTVVENGREVLTALEQASFDAVLMDCQMPEIDGWEATREIRQRGLGGERLPIIAVTAHALEGDRERCLEAGMDDYVAKPYREKVLGAVLERWIDKRKTEP